MVGEVVKKLVSCQVGDVTRSPCRRPAEVEIGGVPFCGPCAGEQEAYFALGELTEATETSRDERLVAVLYRIRQMRRQRSTVGARELLSRSA